MADNTQLKKDLYKEKPEATLQYIKSDGLSYMAEYSKGHVWFTVPLSDIGDAAFLPLMPSQLLIRYIFSWRDDLPK